MLRAGVPCRLLLLLLLLLQRCLGLTHDTLCWLSTGSLPNAAAP